jgi:prevent-host-death family protein
MKRVNLSEAQADLATVVKTAQNERVILEQNGKAVAVVFGVDSYDSEDLETASSEEFWRMIQQRRGSGQSFPISEVHARLVGKRADGTAEEI